MIVRQTMDASISRPWVMLGLLGLVSALFALGLPNLRLDTSSSGLMVDGDPEKAYYEQTKLTFGDDVLISVVLEAASGDVFTPAILTAVQAMTEEIYRVEGISRVDSLTTVRQTVGESGFLNTNLLLESLPTTLEECAPVRAVALRDPTLVGNILSADGRTTAINAFFVGSTQGDLEKQASLAISAVAARYADLPGVTIYPIGMPVIKTILSDSIQAENKILLPLSVVVIMLVLGLLYRSFMAGFLPILTGLISILWTLGFMGHLGMNFNVISTLLPVLLIVVGATEDVHLLSEYFQGLREGHDQKSSLFEMASKSSLAITLTSMTTVIGFATVTINQVPWLREFAIAGTFGIFANFIITIIVVPASLRLLPKPRLGPEKPASGPLHQLSLVLPAWIQRNRRSVLLVSALIAVFLALGIPRLQVSSNFVGFFKADAPIRQSFDRVHATLAGAQTFFIVIDSGRPGGLQDPRVLRDIAALQQSMAGQVDASKSLADSVRLIHREMNDGQDAFFAIPSEEDLIAQYLLMMDSSDLERLADFDLRQAAVLVRHNLSASWQLQSVLDALESFAATQFTSGATIHFTGENVLINRGAQRIALDNLSSLGYALGSILVVISLVFMSLRAGLLAMIPNLLPVFALLGLMGWLGIEIDASNGFVAMIGLGIAVDDTLHLMVRYNKELKRTTDQTAAVRATIGHELVPAISTSISLVIGFMVFLFSQFHSNIEFGILIAVVIGVAGLADVFLTPIILGSTALTTTWDLLRLRVNTAILEDSPLFHGMRPGEFKRMALLGLLKNFPAGHRIISAGEDSRDMFLLLKGRAEVVLKDGRSSQTRLVHLQPGQVFGEMAFITGDQRSADVNALEDAEVLAIDHASMARVQNRFPRIAAKFYANVARVLSRRLRQS